MANRMRQHGDSRSKVIANMGLFWRREVVWSGERKAFKKNLFGSRVHAKREGKIDFWKQAGIYALYADYNLIYVGQAGMGDKSCIGDRLHGHTKDDLAGRWDMFSWFGLRKAKGNGELGMKRGKTNPTVKNLADVLEGILIEVAQPPQNSQKGRFGPGVHRYIQASCEEPREDIEAAITQIRNDMASIKDRLPKVKEEPEQVIKHSFAIRATYKGRIYKARFRPSGKVILNQRTYSSPSAAGRAIVKGACGGWSFWRFRNQAGEWVRLKELRQKGK